MLQSENFQLLSSANKHTHCEQIRMVNTQLLSDSMYLHTA
jgi:hypothetical protein